MIRYKPANAKFEPVQSTVLGSGPRLSSSEAYLVGATQRDSCLGMRERAAARPMGATGSIVLLDPRGCSVPISAGRLVISPDGGGLRRAPFLVSACSVRCARVRSCGIYQSAALADISTGPPNHAEGHPIVDGIECKFGRTRGGTPTQAINHLKFPKSQAVLIARMDWSGASHTPAALDSAAEHLPFPGPIGSARWSGLALWWRRRFSTTRIFFNLRAGAEDFFGYPAKMMSAGISCPLHRKLLGPLLARPSCSIRSRRLISHSLWRFGCFCSHPKQKVPGASRP